MGNTNWDNIAGVQLFDVAFHTLFLYLTAGKNGDWFAVWPAIKAQDAKADHFVYPGNQGDIFGGAVLNSDGAFLFWNDPFHAD